MHETDDGRLQSVGGQLISTLEVPPDDVSSYGVIDPGSQSGALTKVNGLVEKTS